jgi:hypothetical protein
MLAAPAEQLRAVDHGLPRRDRSELGDHPAGLGRLLVGSAGLPAGGATAASRISPRERVAWLRRIARRRPAGLVGSRHLAWRLALAGGAPDRRGDRRPRAGHAGQVGVPRRSTSGARRRGAKLPAGKPPVGSTNRTGRPAAADAMLAIPKL